MSHQSTNGIYTTHIIEFVLQFWNIQEPCHVAPHSLGSDQLRLYGSSTVLRDGAGGGVVVVWRRWSNVMGACDGEVRRPQST